MMGWPGPSSSTPLVQGIHGRHCLEHEHVTTQPPALSDSSDITVQVGYLAMVSFLEELYSKFEFEQLGGILGSLRPLADGTPADPGMWSDWMRAVVLARRAPPVSPKSNG